MKKISAIMLAALLLSCCGCTAVNSTSAQATPEITGAVSYEMTYLKWVVETDYDGDTWIYTNVEVENTGEVPLFLGDGTFDVKDSTGNVIASESATFKAPQVIGVGANGYYYSAILIKKEECAASEIALVDPNLNITPLKTEAAKVAVTESYAIEGDAGRLDIIGTVKNFSDSDVNVAICGAILFDDNYQPIGIVQAIVQDLPAGEDTAFSAEGYFLPDDIRFAGNGKAPYGSYRLYAYEQIVNPE